MLKHVLSVIWSGLVEAFYLLPDFVALFLAAFGIAVIFMSEQLKRLENRPRWRWGIAVTIIVFGCLAFISNQIQKGEDKTNQKALRGQIGTLINNSETQANSGDMKALTDAVSTGFDRLEAAITGSHSAPEKIPSKQGAIQDRRSPSESIRFTQKRVPSTDPENNPYALQIIVQTNVTISPVGLAFNFTGPISSIDFFLAGQPVTMMTQTFVSDDPKIGIVRVGSPALSPDSPMVVNVRSKKNVHLISIDRVSPAMNGSTQPE
jgi:hypothetical protein